MKPNSQNPPIQPKILVEKADLINIAQSLSLIQQGMLAVLASVNNRDANEVVEELSNQIGIIGKGYKGALASLDKICDEAEKQ